MLTATAAESPNRVPSAERRDVVGVARTPVIDVLDDHDASLRLKLESFQPSGSIKHRTATQLIGDLEAAGALGADTTLVESSSGNLAVALAAIARGRGVDFTAVVDPKTSPVVLDAVTALGARLEVVEDADPVGGYLPARIARVHQLLAADPRARWTNQYGRLANPAAHFATTAPEIDAQRADADVILVAVSTGGTLAGIDRWFRLHRPQVRVVGVDVVGSTALGGRSGPRALTGIGAGRRSSFLNSPGRDVVKIEESEAVATCVRLEADTGIGVGASSGAVVAAARRHLAEHPGVPRAMCLCPDGAEKYRGSVYDPAWCDARGELDGWSEHAAGIGFSRPARRGGQR